MYNVQCSNLSYRALHKVERKYSFEFGFALSVLFLDKNFVHFSDSIASLVPNLKNRWYVFVSGIAGGISYLWNVMQYFT